MIVKTYSHKRKIVCFIEKEKNRFLKMEFPYFARMDFSCTESNIEDVCCLVRAQIRKICKQDSNLKF